jgi:hypothetical protein
MGAFTQPSMDVCEVVSRLGIMGDLHFPFLPGLSLFHVNVIVGFVCFTMTTS